LILVYLYKKPPGGDVFPQRGLNFRGGNIHIFVVYYLLKVE